MKKLTPAEYKARYAAASKAAKSGQNLPTGQTYSGKLTDTWHGYNKASGQEQVSFTWTVIDGEYAGRKQIQFHNIGNENSTVPLEIFLGDLLKFGYNPEELTSFEATSKFIKAMKMHELACEFEMKSSEKNGKTYINFRMLQVLQGCGESGASEVESTEPEIDEGTDEVPEVEEAITEVEEAPSEDDDIQEGDTVTFKVGEKTLEGKIESIAPDAKSAKIIGPHPKTEGKKARYTVKVEDIVGKV